MGVSHTAIQKAIATGRMTRPGKHGLDLAKATRQWRESGGGLTMAGVGATPTKKPPQKGAKQPEKAQHAAPLQGDEPPEPEEETPQDPTSRSYLQGRAMERVFKAKIARMEHDRMAGELISAKAVRQRVHSVGREIRDQILNVPNRIAAELAAMTEPHAVHLRLSEELNQTLTSIADRLAAALTEAAEQ